MNISKLASTVIMATSISTLLLFAFVLFLYNGDAHSLDKAFSITASFFGGIATLVAAYIATQLFNDWRLQHNQSSLKDVALNIFNTLTTLHVKLVAINDVFYKSLKKYKINQSTYNITGIANDIEDSVGQIGDLLTNILHQINFLKIILNTEDDILDEMQDIILEYITVMDISYYIQTNDHLKFIQEEAKIKARLDDLRDDLNNYLKKIIVIKVN